MGGEDGGEGEEALEAGLADANEDARREGHLAGAH